MKGNTKVMLSVFITYQGHVLLNCIGNRVTSPSWAAVGKRFEQEYLDEAKRSMLKYLDIQESDLDSIKLRYVTMRYKDGEIRQNCFYFVEAKNDLNIGPIGNKKWINFYQLPEMELPTTISSIMKHYLSVGSTNDLVYAGVMKEKGYAISELEEF